MSEKFSATIQLGDLNDFIAPSQSCIVSVKGRKLTPAKRTDQPEVYIAPKQVPAEPVTISLKDCLACSGCITSAETVLLEKQSLDEFLANINKGNAVIVSVSPQSRASLAVHFGISSLQVLKKLVTLFKSMGVKAVFDTNSSKDITLIESCKEFVTRYEQSKIIGGENGELPLPMLASSCPGWICYAEKTLGSFILPYISSVKSPQQAMGTIIKNHVCQKMGLGPEDVYHVTVMPCYDKKLEAVRDDFVFEVESQNSSQEKNVLRVSEVDSVLTSGEVLDLIKLKAVDFKSLEESPLDDMMINVNENGELFGVLGSSGGYGDTIFRYAAKNLFGRDIQGPLDFKIIRNSDFQEVILEVDGETKLKFALCYGFRNLQNIVRKIKSKKCDYDFVEVMACPSGCLNGGGQIKPEPGQTGKDLIQSLNAVYAQNVFVADPFVNPLVRRLYDEWLEQPGSKKAKKYMHTSYHPVIKTTSQHIW
ncbi:hypothetical protein SAY87_022840 [Trapa incisa]|uniref:Iron hydrogenase small subunit domain-containing protein n=1 Tax=Trapa incisa TaxID=236973 RepID=A0AAN7Q634_9MYRT|nr:hypothetical protein SAY87_022840 [Trapa incisa]